MLLALMLAGGSAASAPAAGPVELTRDQKLRRVEELRTFLTGRERELARLVAAHREKTKEAETLGRQVDALKAKPNRSWMEQRDLEKLLAGGRVRLEEIERLAEQETGTRDEAFAAAAALVAEYESFMQEDLVRLRDLAGPVSATPLSASASAERRALTDRVLVYERERRIFQGKMNALTPANPMPIEIPRSAKWTKEMIEDQRRAWEAAIARLQADRNQLVQEQGLRRALAEALPGATVTADSAAADSRLAARVEDLDRKIALYRDKLARLSGGSRGRN
ncbi:MAG: hypothetical protein AAB152_05305 [Candidatus Coatesbacteria bacterium]